MDTCKSKFLKFSRTGELIDLFGCFPDLHLFKNPEDILNPLNYNLDCKLISTKKQNYYIHKYEPFKIIDSINQEFCDNIYKKELLDNMEKVFDLNPREKCCNCVSVILYLTSDPEKYHWYLSSIKKTVKNIDKYLPDFILRFYLDSSVYEKLLNQQENPNYISTLKYIIEAPNVETYTYMCQEIINENIQLKLTRTFRFLPFIDPYTNICISREADGLVTALDCHNIEVFRNSNRILYLNLESSDRVEKTPPPLRIGPYSDQLRFNLNKEFDSTFYLYRVPLIDFYAGIFAIKLKVKYEYYKQKIEELNYRIKILQEENNKSIYIYDFYKNYAERIGIPRESILGYFIWGYDENLLLNLFKEFVSVRFFEKSGQHIYDPDQFKLIKSLYFGKSDTEIISLEGLTEGLEEDILNRIQPYVSINLSKINKSKFLEAYKKINTIYDISQTQRGLNYLIDAIIGKYKINKNQILDINQILSYQNIPYGNYENIDVSEINDQIYELGDNMDKFINQSGGSNYYNKNK